MSSMAIHPLFCVIYFQNIQPVTEEVKKKELSDRDVDMGFDITMTKHKGQVRDKI